MNDIEEEKLIDGEHAIDELDKANLIEQSTADNNAREVSVGSNYHIAALSNVVHENFILDCVNKSPDKAIVLEIEDIVCTPGALAVDLGRIGECSKSKNLDYCSELLKSVDMEESDDDGSVEEELDVLPPVVVEIISLGVGWLRDRSL